MLPELHSDPNNSNSRIGSLQFEGREVALRINPDDATAEECIASALKAVLALQEIDSKAKDTAARCMLSNYNDNWRHYSRAGEEGIFVDVHDPELTASDFKARLSMTALEALGTSCYTIFYNDDRMFAGHSIVITSFDGLQFSDSFAELFG